MLIEKWEYGKWTLKDNACYWTPEQGLRARYILDYYPERIVSWITSLNKVTAKLHNTDGLGKVDIVMTESTFDLLEIQDYCYYDDKTNKIDKNFNLEITNIVPDNAVFILSDGIMKGKIEIDLVERSVKEWYELLIERLEDACERRGEKVFRKNKTLN